MKIIIFEVDGQKYYFLSEDRYRIDTLIKDFKKEYPGDIGKMFFVFKEWLINKRDMRQLVAEIIDWSTIS